MATITFTADSSTMTDIINAFSEDYQAFLPGGIANPQTRTQFAKAKFLQTVKSQVFEYKKRQLTPPADSDIAIS